MTPTYTLCTTLCYDDTTFSSRSVAAASVAALTEYFCIRCLTCTKSAHLHEEILLDLR